MMRSISKTVVLLAFLNLSMSAGFAQETPDPLKPTKHPPDVVNTGPHKGSSSSSSSHPSTGTKKSVETLIRENKHDTSMPVIESTSGSVVKMFVPKFKQRLMDLADQVKMAQTKGWITAAEASKFMERQAKLLVSESEASKKHFPKADIDFLEREITLLNGDLFKSMRKDDPVKPGQADKEVNDPNLIPAYPDPELQPNSGVKN